VQRLSPTAASAQRTLHDNGRSSSSEEDPTTQVSRGRLAMGMTSIDQITDFWNRYTKNLEDDLTKARQENTQMRRLLFLVQQGSEMSEDGWGELNAQIRYLLFGDKK
jgi:hypothetical protein